MFSILQGVLESDGIERKIQTAIQTFLKRLNFESPLTFIDKIPALCCIITSTVILDSSAGTDIKMLEAFQYYAAAANCEDRYVSENIIRETIHFALNKARTSITEWKERLYMGNGGDDTDFSNSCCFLEIFLERHSMNVEDNITVLLQFLVEQVYIPLVEQMTTVMRLILNSTSSTNLTSSVKLYKEIMKMKKEPCDANQKLVYTKSSTLSWVSLCISSLKQREDNKKPRTEELKRSAEGVNSITTNQNIDAVSEYKLAIRRLVQESREKTEFSKRAVYYRADVNRQDDINVKDVITLKFPSDIMMDENYDVIEKSVIFDVILCSLAHQMIEFDWIGGSEFMDETKNRNDIIQSKDAFRC